MKPKQIEKTSLTLGLAGDSGDGIQTIGALMTLAGASSKNFIQTDSDYPADMRAPAGSLFGISSYKITLASFEVYCVDDYLDILLAFNPAALKTKLNHLNKGGLLIVDSDKFIDKELSKAEYDHNPLNTEELKTFNVISLPLSTKTVEALKSLNLTAALAKKSKNFFALGLLLFLYNKDTKVSEKWIKAKFKNNQIQIANLTALIAGYKCLKEDSQFTPKETYIIKPGNIVQGMYKLVTGNQACSLGILSVATSTKSNVFIANYPITPASDIFHELAKLKNLGVTTFQAEDEIAAISAAIGAAYGGKPAITCTSGPGFDLISEATGLAIMAELPLVIVNVQRAGPSTGMPTKTEQSDLLTALYGRHGEAPLIVLAAKSPKDCYNSIIEAFSLAIKYMTPVIVLSDAHIANCQEPLLLPDINSLPEINLNFENNNDNINESNKDSDDDANSFQCVKIKKNQQNTENSKKNQENQKNTESNKFMPYKRNTETLARNWAIPGTFGKEHVIGGLEKKDETGEVCYEPFNHQKMSEYRKKKIQLVANDFPKIEVIGKSKGNLLIISWGSTFGPIQTAINQFNLENKTSNFICSWVHLRHINPLPIDLFQIITNFDSLLIIENNLGQLSKVITSYIIEKNNFNHNKYVFVKDDCIKTYEYGCNFDNNDCDSNNTKMSNDMNNYINNEKIVHKDNKDIGNIVNNIFTFNKVTGLPFKVSEIKQKIKNIQNVINQVKRGM